jgi:hypothetical protein
MDWFCYFCNFILYFWVYETGTIYFFLLVRVTYELFIWIICSSQEINGDEKEVAVGIAVCTLAVTNYPGLRTQ